TTKGGSEVFDVPQGLMILGETSSAPAGYTSTGLQTDVITGPQLWTTKASMSTARYALAAAALNGKVYAFGGNNGGYLTTAEVFDPVVNGWTSTGSMPV